MDLAIERCVMMCSRLKFTKNSTLLDIVFNVGELNVVQEAIQRKVRQLPQ